MVTLGTEVLCGGGKVQGVGVIGRGWDEVVPVPERLQRPRVVLDVRLEDQVIAYSSLIVRPMPKLSFFQTGTNLKVVEPQRAVVPSKQRAVPTIKAE